MTVAGLVTDGLPGSGIPLDAESAQIVEKGLFDGGFIQVPDQHQHAVIDPGESALKELLRLGLRPLVQGGRIFPRRIIESGIHHGYR